MVENHDDDEPTGAPSYQPGAVAPVARTAGSSGAAVPTTDVQAYIGRQLRAVYDDVAKQPIPDRFLALMRQLETKGSG